MSTYYRPTLMFLKVEEVKKDKRLKLNTGTMRAVAGDYIVTFPDGQQAVMKPDFVEAFYEPVDDPVFCDLCFDFDGVLHIYTTPWTDAATVSDPPVPGALRAVNRYLNAEMPLTVAVYSARSAQPGGIEAMQAWIERYDDSPRTDRLVDRLLFPTTKPAAKVYIDDRGYRFTGEFPSVDAIVGLFSPWNAALKKPKVNIDTPGLILPNMEG